MANGKGTSFLPTNHFCALQIIALLYIQYPNLQKVGVHQQKLGVRRTCIPFKSEGAVAPSAPLLRARMISGYWWLLVAISGYWWLLVAISDYWWLLVAIGDQ